MQSLLHRLPLRLFLLGVILTISGVQARAGTYNLVLERRAVNITGRPAAAMLINGQLPGPLLRFKEGENVTINVTNQLDEPASIHWHGLIVPPEMDGVPGISPGYGNGIQPGTTFTYRFKVKQSGTYWYHTTPPASRSNSGFTRRSLSSLGSRTLTGTTVTTSS